MKTPLIMDEIHTERFWAKVRKTEACWYWTASKNTSGYGQFNTGNGRIWRTHRISWIMERGQINPNSHVLHRCDNPACVNPNHLFLGSQKDNILDCIHKGRSPILGKKGDKHPTHRLSPEDIGYIRNSSDLQETLARRFGVHQPQISRIKSGHRWSHL